jgi:hypothetical protein
LRFRVKLAYAGAEGDVAFNVFPSSVTGSLPAQIISYNPIDTYYLIQLTNDLYNTLGEEYTAGVQAVNSLGISGPTSVFHYAAGLSTAPLDVTAIPGYLECIIKFRLPDYVSEQTTGYQYSLNDINYYDVAYTYNESTGEATTAKIPLTVSSYIFIRANDAAFYGVSGLSGRTQNQVNPQVPQAPLVELISFTKPESGDSEVSFRITPRAVGASPLTRIKVRLLVVTSEELGTVEEVNFEEYYDAPSLSGFADFLTYTEPQLGKTVIIRAECYNLIGVSFSGEVSFAYVKAPAIPDLDDLSVFAPEGSPPPQTISLSWNGPAYLQGQNSGNTPLTTIKADIYNGNTLESVDALILLGGNLQQQNTYTVATYPSTTISITRKVIVRLINAEGTTEVVFDNIFIEGAPNPPTISDVFTPVLGTLSFRVSPTGGTPDQLIYAVTAGSYFSELQNISTAGNFVTVNNLPAGVLATVTAYSIKKTLPSTITQATKQLLGYPYFSSLRLEAIARRNAFKIDFDNPLDCGGCPCAYTIYAYKSNNWAGLSETSSYPADSITIASSNQGAYVYLPSTTPANTQYKFIVDISNCGYVPDPNTAYAQNQRLLLFTAVSSSTSNSTPFAPTLTTLDESVTGGGAVEIIANISNTADAGIAWTKFQYNLVGTTWIDVPAADTSLYGENQYKITIRNLVNWSNYAVRIRLNTNGDPSAALSATPEGVPQARTLLAQGTVYNNKIVANISKLSAPGYTLTGYKFTTNASAATPVWRSASLSPTNVLDGDLTTTFTIYNQSNLAPLVIGTPYAIQILAINSYGDGTPSNTVNHTMAGAPLKITSVNHTSLNLGLAIIVNFASNGGSPITRYKWTLNGDAASPTWITVNTTSQSSVPISVTTWQGVPLVNGTQYYFKVYAENLAGAGEISDTFTMIPSTVPSAPTIVSLVPLDKKLRVMYTPPTSDGGNSVKNYAYSYDDGVSFKSLVPAEANPPYIDVPNLINGEYYIIKIRAINDRGFGPTSNYKINAPNA